MCHSHQNDLYNNSQSYKDIINRQMIIDIIYGHYIIVATQPQNGLNIFTAILHRGQVPESIYRTRTAP